MPLLKPTAMTKVRPTPQVTPLLLALSAMHVSYEHSR